MDTTEHESSVGRTSIQVSERLADELYERKGRGESYEDVIWSLIEDSDGESEPAPSADDPVSGVGSTPTDLEEYAQEWVGQHYTGQSTYAEAVAAVQAALEYARANERTRKKDYLDDVATRVDGGYKKPTSKKGSWWRALVKPALREHPSVVIDGDQADVYVWEAPE